MSYQGKKNVYDCRSCPAQICTVDRDEGTTPFMVKCPFCERGMMQSRFYRVDQTLRPAYEFYAPDAAERAASKPAMRRHADMGGLFFRKIAPLTNPQQVEP